MEETVRDSFRMESIVGWGLPGRGLVRASSRAAVEAAAASAASGRLNASSFITTKVRAACSVLHATSYNVPAACSPRHKLCDLCSRICCSAGRK